MDLTDQEDDDLRAVRVTHASHLADSAHTLELGDRRVGLRPTATLALAVVEARWTREEALAEAPIHPRAMERAIERAFAETRPDVVR